MHTLFYKKLSKATPSLRLHKVCHLCSDSVLQRDILARRTHLKRALSVAFRAPNHALGFFLCLERQSPALSAAVQVRTDSNGQQSEDAAHDT